MNLKTDKAAYETGNRAIVTAEIPANRRTAAAFEWTVNGTAGQTGESIQFDLPNEGIVQFSVRVREGGTIIAEASGALSVFSATDPTPDIFNLPDVYGDMNSSGSLELLDVLRIAQAARGSIPPETRMQRLSGDLDLDQEVSGRDTELAALAVMGGQPLPFSFLAADVSFYPGEAVAISAPQTLRATTNVEVRMGGETLTQISRPTLGYVIVSLPIDPVSAASPRELAVLVDGQIAGNLPFELLPAPQASTDPRQDIRDFLSQFRAELSAQRAGLQAELTELGTTGNDAAILLAATDSSIQTVTQLEREFETFFTTTTDPRTISAVRDVLVQSGLNRFRAELSSGSVLNSEPLRATAFNEDACRLVDNYCLLRKTVSRLKTGIRVIATACAGLGVLPLLDGFVPIGDAAAVAGLVSVCIPAATNIELGITVAEVLTSVGNPTLGLSSSSTSLASGQTATLRATVDFISPQELCGQASNLLLDELVKKIRDRLMGRYLLSPIAQGNHAELFATYGGDVLNAFLRSVNQIIESSINAVVSVTRLESLIGQPITAFCASVIDPSKPLTVPAQKVLDPNSLPLGAGILVFNTDGTASYTCPPPGPVFRQSETFVARKQLCDGPGVSKPVTISCATSEVTITMGDNGSANDDIYAVIIDGQTVLTSSAPTRAVSVTLTLPRGRTTVQMRGLAAPDGIGTYYIQFSGAAVVGGDATSGSDLVPGTTKTFIIEVL